MCTTRLSRPRSRVRFPASFGTARAGRSSGTDARAAFAGGPLLPALEQRSPRSSDGPRGASAHLNLRVSQSRRCAGTAVTTASSGTRTCAASRKSPTRALVRAARRRRQQAARRRAAAPLRRLAQHTLEQLRWSGTAPIGAVQLRVGSPPFSQVVYYRLTEGGDTVLGPVDITTTSDRWGRDRRRLQPHRQPVRGGLACGSRRRGGALVPARRGVGRTLVGGPALLGSYTGYNDTSRWSGIR